MEWFVRNSCWWIPQLQHPEAVQREICKSRERSFCGRNQRHQKGLGGVCALQSSLANRIVVVAIAAIPTLLNFLFPSLRFWLKIAHVLTRKNKIFALMLTAADLLTLISQCLT